MKRTVVKTIASFASGIAVSGLMGMLIKSNAIPTNTKEKIFVSLGGFVLGGMVSDKASLYVEDMVDKAFDIFDGFNQAKQMNEGEVNG